MLRPTGFFTARIRALPDSRLSRALAALGIVAFLSAAALPASAASTSESAPSSAASPDRNATAQAAPAPLLSGRLTVDCVIKDKKDNKGAKDTYRAVFGYDNYTDKAVTVPLGASNMITPHVLDGGQPTDFLPGEHRGAFTTGETTAAAITWRVGVYTVAATKYSTACTGPVDLPAEGNGAGPAIVIVLSLGVVAIAAGVLYRRRKSA